MNESQIERKVVTPVLISVAVIRSSVYFVKVALKLSKTAGNFRQMQGLPVPPSEAHRACRRCPLALILALLLVPGSPSLPAPRHVTPEARGG